MIIKKTCAYFYCPILIYQYEHLYKHSPNIEYDIISLNFIDFTPLDLNDQYILTILRLEIALEIQIIDEVTMIR